MQQRRGVPRDGGVQAYQPSYSYQNGQYNKYSSQVSQGLGGKPRHYNYHQNDCKVYIGGLPQQITEADLGARMTEFGSVQQVNIIYDEQGNSRGFGFVTFRNSEEAKSALGIIDMYGKTVEVKFSNKNASAHQNDMRHRNYPSDHIISERHSANSYGVPYSYQMAQKQQKFFDSEELNNAEHSTNIHQDSYPKPPSNEKANSKKLLRKSSQHYEYQGLEKEQQKVQTPSEKHHITSEASTRYTDSIDNESISKGTSFPQNMDAVLASKPLGSKESQIGNDSTPKRQEEPHRTISKHSNPYHPPVNSLPAVLPEHTAVSPAVPALEYNPHNFGIYFNPQQNMYTQPGMGFMMNQFMNFGPVFDQVAAAVDFPRPAQSLSIHDSPSLPAVETRITFYTFPGRV